MILTLPNMQSNEPSSAPSRQYARDRLRHDVFCATNNRRLEPIKKKAHLLRIGVRGWHGGDDMIHYFHEGITKIHTGSSLAILFPPQRQHKKITNSTDRCELRVKFSHEPCMGRQIHLSNLARQNPLQTRTQTACTSQPIELRKLL